MAACRQNIPLRYTAGVVRIADGTMCRMPSPLPGPLRGQPLDPSGTFGSGWSEGVSSESGAFEPEDGGMAVLGKNALQPSVKKVA